ncbi:MAG: hypothetical protein NXI24_10040 [bacterium]|nr:hypothetical protein [bacterium]
MRRLRPVKIDTVGGLAYARACAYACTLAFVCGTLITGCGAYSSFSKDVLGEYSSGVRQNRATLDRANHDRYWRYRLRLATEFMDPGEGPGKHLPADTIIIRGKRVNVIRFADATLQLAWYIGVLALETAMLESAGPEGAELRNAARRNPDRVKLEARIPEQSFGSEPAHLRELYFALAAFDRLDRIAEPSFAKVCAGQAADVPGFFIRDDVSDSPEMRARMNRLWIESDYASLEQADCRVRRPESNANANAKTNGIRDCLDECPECFNGEASQDQVYHLLMGLALVKRFVPPGTIVRGVDLNERARSQARRLIAYLARNEWEMINPVCERPVRRGSYAEGYSYATACSAEKLTDGEYRPEASSCLWTGAGLSGNPLYQNPDNRHLAMVLAAVGEAWGEDTYIDLQDLAASEDWHLYPLLYIALHDPPAVSRVERNRLRAKLRPLIDSAPPDGPSFDGAPNPNPGWSSANRFLRGRDRQRGGGESYGAIYNGLDYMLLYGLERIVFAAD